MCNAYSRKIQAQILPIVVRILSREVDVQNAVVEGGDGMLATNAPKDLTTLMSEFFQIVLAKKIKELTVKVLKVFTTIIK